LIDVMRCRYGVLYSTVLYVQYWMSLAIPPRDSFHHPMGRGTCFFYGQVT
jgi:hypothetical protein